MYEICKTRVVSHCVRERLHSNPLQDIRLLLECSLKPGKHLVVIAEADIGLNKWSGWDITLLPSFFQLGNQTKRVRTSASMAIRSRQDANDAGAFMSKGSCPLEWWDSILGF